MTTNISLSPAVTSEVPVHTRLELPLTILTPEAFRSYGTVLTPNGRERLPINTYGDKLDLYRESFESDQPIEWFLVTLRPRWRGMLFLERHQQLTQTFIPLNGLPFITIVAPPNCPEVDGFPALSEVRAFLVPGDSPIQLYGGTWHENPLPTTDLQNLLVTSHAALTRGHQANHDPKLDTLPLDLERKWFIKSGYEITVANQPE